MEEKRIDNEIITTNEKINQIDEQIDSEKIRIKEIEHIQENIRELNKEVDYCIELLEKSMKGPKASIMFKDMYDRNKSIYVNMASSLDEESLEKRININKLYQQKDEVLKEETKNRGAEDANSTYKEGDSI